MIEIDKQNDFTYKIANKSYALNQPLFATLHNHICHNRCNYCYLKYLSKNENSQIVEDNIFDDEVKYYSLLEELKNNGVLKLIFSGGEPLVIKNFKKKIVLARKMGFSVEIITSGYSWNDSIVNFVALSGISVILSFSGSQSHIHDEIVGKQGNFKKIFKLFLQLNLKKVPMSINFLITKYNYFDVSNFFNLFKKYNVVINCSYDISPFLENPQKVHQLYLNKEQFFEVIKQLEKKIR